jgi:hypothetical protein
MTFDEWAKIYTPGYFNGDNNNTMGYLRDCWRAAQLAQRERSANELMKYAHNAAGLGPEDYADFVRRCV